MKIISATYAFAAAEAALIKFGTLGFNPIIATVVVIFKVSQTDGSASPYANYLWVYYIGPMVGAVLAAILHLFHVKIANKNGGDIDYD